MTFEFISGVVLGVVFGSMLVGIAIAWFERVPPRE